MNPQVVGLDVVAYQAAMNQINKNGVKMDVSGRKASGTATVAQDSMLVTTIPYDKGWQVKVDGKKAEIESFQNAFLMVKLPAGEHKITFSYLPQGFIIGAILFVLCIALFVLYVWYLNKDNPRPAKKRERRYKHS
jgi:uncharacterized membrane protein YfhO